MEIGRIAGATRNLAEPTDWNAERHGLCLGLPVRDEAHAPGLHRMVSAWFPLPSELAALSAGAPVYLYVIGSSHPPVWVGVGSPPVEGAPVEVAP